MRVLLFVEREGRVVSVGQSGRLGKWPWMRRPVALGLFPDEYGITSNQQRAVEAAPRWWLVQAADADEGRLVIEFFAEFPPDGPGLHGSATSGGRVLASGGKP